MTYFWVLLAEKRMRAQNTMRIRDAVMSEYMRMVKSLFRFFDSLSSN